MVQESLRVVLCSLSNRLEPQLYPSMIFLPFMPPRVEPNQGWTMELRREAGQHFSPDTEPDVFTFWPRTDVGLSSEAVEQLFTTLYPKPGNRGATARRQAVQCATFALACCGPYTNVGFLQSTATSSSAANKRHWPGRFKSRVFGDVLTAIADYGLLTQHMGVKDRLHPKGLTTLWTLTERGREWIQDAQRGATGVSFSEQREPLLLKSDKKKVIPYEDDDCTRAIREQVCRTNESRARHSWVYTPVDLEESGKGSNAEWVYADVQVTLPSVDLDCHRDFHQDFKTGGRYYCKAQQLRKVERSTLTIDDLPTVELDYSSHQTRILYHLCGLDAPEDCYAIDGQPRWKWKKVAVIALNSKSRRQAMNALEHQESIEKPEVKQLISDYCSEHSPIAHKFFQGRWGELFYAESQLTMDILDSAYEADIPVLPIHDSFVTTTQRAHELREIMERCYLERFGFPACIGENTREEVDAFFAELEGQLWD